MPKKTLLPSAPTVIVERQMIVHSSSNSKIDFGRIASQMEKGKMTPKEISDAINLIAAYIGRLSFMLGTLAARRAVVVNECRDNYKSMAETERAWEATESGQQEIMIEHMIKAFEKMHDALRTQWFLIQGEKKLNH